MIRSLDWTLQYLPGVITSLLAVLVLYLAGLVKNRWHRRYLKKALCFSGGGCAIVAPLYRAALFEVDGAEGGPVGDGPSEVLHRQDALALSHLLDVCRRVSVDPSISFGAIESGSAAADIIAFGGTISNEVTHRFLKLHCPGFGLVQDAGALAPKGYRCGGHEFLTGGDVEFAALVRLTSSELGRDGTVHLLFGNTGLSTAAAAYYLWKYHRELARFGSRRYFLIVEVGIDGYKQLKQRPMNLTEVAFAPEAAILLAEPS